MDVTIRKIQKQEYPLLDNFLYEAIFIPEGIEPPPKSIISSPELQIYVKHFGKSKDDWGLAAEVAEYEERNADVRIAQYESGYRVPQNNTLMEMAKILNVNYIYFIGVTPSCAEDIMLTFL